MPCLRLVLLKIFILLLYESSVSSAETVLCILALPGLAVWSNTLFKKKFKNTILVANIFLFN